MPHEYKPGEAMDGLQEGPLIHGVEGGASGTVRPVEVTSAGAGHCYLTNATIEQTTGDPHNNLNIAVAGKDSAGNVSPFSMDTNRVLQVDVVESAGLSGDGLNYAATMTTAVTQVPATAPTAPYVMAIHNGDDAIEMFWNFASGTTGGISLEAVTGKASFRLAASQVIYVFADSGTPLLHYTVKGTGLSS